MKPTLVYNTAFQMTDGRAPDLTLGNSYEIISAFDTGDGADIVIIDDLGSTHYFGVADPLTIASFDMLGDYTDVWEAIH